MLGDLHYISLAEYLTNFIHIFYIYIFMFSIFFEICY